MTVTFELRNVNTPEAPLYAIVAKADGKEAIGLARWPSVQAALDQLAQGVEAGA